MTIYLYVKTHMKTGIKYLGKTESDPFTYKGSGKKWKQHINKHGNDVWTNVIFQSDSKEEIREKGIAYSEKWNVVNSSEWANLKLEEGDGGSFKHSEELKEKYRVRFAGEGNPMFGKERPKEWREQQSSVMQGRYTGKNNPMFGKRHSNESKDKMKTHVGKHWFNNGRTSILCYPSEVPDGFVRGRFLKVAE